MPPSPTRTSLKDGEVCCAGAAILGAQDMCYGRNNDVTEIHCQYKTKMQQAQGVSAATAYLLDQCNSLPSGDVREMMVGRQTMVVEVDMMKIQKSR